jgi:hypothetical protein
VTAMRTPTGLAVAQNTVQTSGTALTGFMTFTGKPSRNMITNAWSAPIACAFRAARLVSTPVVHEKAHYRDDRGQAQHDVGDQSDHPARMRGPQGEPDRRQLNGEHDRGGPRLGDRNETTYVTTMSSSTSAWLSAQSKARPKGGSAVGCALAASSTESGNWPPTTRGRRVYVAVVVRPGGPGR